MKRIKAWHFLPADRRLAYDDKRLVKKGQKLTIEPPVKMCERGLHASIRAIDAISFKRGPIICRVEVGGEIETTDDKIVGTERTVLWWADATNTLHEFACWCASRALKTANITDERCNAAIATKLRWLKGEATDEELGAAESAAKSAAESAASSAARSAWGAAWSAAESAAWSAARGAAESAARTAWSATWSAARGAAESAAWSAWGAAWGAAESAQNTKLTAMLNKLAN